MHELPIVTLGGIQFDLSSIIMIVITSVIVFILARIGTSRLSVNNPGKMQNFLEWVVDFVEGLIASTMDLKRGKSYLMLGITLIMFIFVGNMLGLPFGIVFEVNEPMPVFGITAEELHHAHDAGKHIALTFWKSPTADVAVTMGLAVIVIVMVHFLGLTKNTHHYLKHYVEPHWAMFPLNVIKEVSKLLTLGLRLFGNIYAGEVLIGVILMAGFWGILPLIVWQGFSVFVGAIQAFVFTILTMVYISQATEHGDEH